MNEKHHESTVKRTLSTLVKKFFDAFVMNSSNVSAADMNRYLTVTSSFWMMDGGYVGEYHAQTKTYPDELKD